MLLTKPDVIIMDEPTNHLDILSKESITMMLQQFTGVSLIISHDRDFLSQVSNILRVIQDNELTVYHDVEKGFEMIG
jgi:ATPase subunit of ABC transporter with duplicated ATPase domains